ncbi:MAG: hypothetical protein R2790_00180 [Flavobacterium haoranii]
MKNVQTKLKELIKLMPSKLGNFILKAKNNGKPNPYYVGFGNPNARIVIFEKKKVSMKLI